MTTTYHAGNKIKYTGVTIEKHGGLFYEYKILDGHKKGALGYTQKSPVTIEDLNTVLSLQIEDIKYRLSYAEKKLGIDS